MGDGRAPCNLLAVGHTSPEQQGSDPEQVINVLNPDWLHWKNLL